MAFNTKIDLSDSKSYQATGQTLTLSGQTKIATSTGLKYVTHPTFTGSTQIVDKKYVDDSIVTATGSTVYNLQSPAAITLGGITCGTILTGLTSNCILQKLLVPELYGTLTDRVGSISSSAAATYEIGNSVTFNITGSFSQGCINPQYCSTSDKRVGAPNTYIFAGACIAGTYACTALSVIKSVTGYAILSGSQTWSVCTKYDAGVQPKGSKGTNFDSACLSGTTAAASTSISGILPWYWGTKKVTNVISSADVAAGTKTVASASGTLPIIFNSASDDYIWFAVPAGTPVKTCWYVNGTNNGCIGGVNNLFATCCNVAVTSAQGCWTGCSYMVYTSCITTGTAVGIPMCMS
jgi:hypothetical protein